MFGSAGGLSGGCAVGTEQFQRHCRPYQVPPGTIVYHQALSGTFRVPLVTTVYRQVSSDIIVFRQVSPCILRYRQVPVTSNLCLSLFGESQVYTCLLLPYPGARNQCTLRCLRHLPFPIRGKARLACTCPFPIRGKPPY